MAADDFSFESHPGPHLAPQPSSRVVAPESDLNDALERLAEAQDSLSTSLRYEHDDVNAANEVDLLLAAAQATAEQIVERAELEALTIRRLMRIEAERLVATVERLKERASRLESHIP